MITERFSDKELFESSDHPETIRYFWKNKFSEEEKSEIIERGFIYWRNTGFPFLRKSRNELKAAFQRLVSFNPSHIHLPGDQLAAISIGVEVANSYHPKMFEVHCNEYKDSVMDYFKNDKNLRTSIGKAFLTTGICNDQALRAMLRTAGAQMPSNFNPAIVRWIYSNFSDRGARILDPSAGWGGRALAAAATPHRHYIGIDPHLAAIEGNRQMIKDLQEINPQITTTHEFIVGCAEDVMPDLTSDSFDLIFTSPPYFDVEKYSDEPGQSYLKHGSNGYSGWLEGFLEPVLKECNRLLKPDGWCLINVGESIRKTYPFGEDTLRLGSIHMQHVNTYYLRLMGRTYHMKKNERGERKQNFRLEPVFLFSKKGSALRPFPHKEPKSEVHPLSLLD